ncbi:ABC transporter ATP-binding protein [Thalassotalea fusca]
MGRLIIQTDNLEKSFYAKTNRSPVLKKLNLSIFEGEMTAIMGPSGSGKSTLLSILGLLDADYEGSLKFCNTDVSTLDNRQKSILRNKNIGWVFQNFNLIGDMTVLENVCLPLRFNKAIKKSAYQSLALEQLDKLGLEDKANSFPEELSGGQQQRVAIARALVTSPDIILCDEPTGNLDSKNESGIMDLLQGIHKQGRTILIITHSDKVAERCERVVSISDGVLC